MRYHCIKTEAASGVKKGRERAVVDWSRHRGVDHQVCA